MNWKGITFDLEGTVVNVEPAHHNAHLRVAASVGLTLTVEEAIRGVPHFIGGPDIAIMREIKRLSRCQKSPEELLAQKQQEYQNLLASMEIKPRPGWANFYERMFLKRVPMSIGSATAPEDAMPLLHHSGIMNVYFTRGKIILGDGVKNPKPAPDVYLQTAELMGIDPKDQLVFEDSPRGVMAAVAAGSDVVAMPVYGDNEDAVSALRDAGACHICKDWLEAFHWMFEH